LRVAGMCQSAADGGCWKIPYRDVAAVFYKIMNLLFHIGYSIIMLCFFATSYFLGVSCTLTHSSVPCAVASITP